MTANPADPVTDSNARGPARFDRTLRTVMWLDAFLSVALVVVCVIASPILATVDVPEAALSVIGLALIVCAVLLAAFGAITAVALMLRMHAGHYLLPVDLRLPLPAPMRPAPLNPYDSPVEKKSKQTPCGRDRMRYSTSSESSSQRASCSATSSSSARSSRVSEAKPW